MSSLRLWRAALATRAALAAAAGIARAHTMGGAGFGPPGSSSKIKGGRWTVVKFFFISVRGCHVQAGMGAHCL